MIVGVRLDGEPILYFETEKELGIGEMVVVEYGGIRLGKIVEKPSGEVKKVLKRFIRRATPQEIEAWEKLSEANNKALEEARKLAPDLKILKASFSLDRKTLTLYFIPRVKADVKKIKEKLKKHFGVRVEMKQLGVRDGARLVGGIGMCGRETCCSTFLSHFESITLKMAKEQNLPLNPEKISGICGRLLCCLSFDHPFYLSLGKIPKVGSKVKTELGEGKVIEVSPIKGEMTVEIEGRRVKLPFSSVV